MAELSMGDVIDLVGGDLDDETAAKDRLRAFLLNPKWRPDKFEAWIQECLERGTGDHGVWNRALQDTVVAVGGHLGFEVEFGYYEESGIEKADFDGLWRRATGEAMLIEVTASAATVSGVDGLRKSLRRCAELRGAGQNTVFGLCVVGNANANLLLGATEDNERDDWLRFITVKDLIRLWRLKIDLEEMVGRLLGPSSNLILYSEVLAKVQPELDKIAAELPPGYRLELGGAKEEADKGGRLTAKSLGISVALIYILLVIQFNSTVKPIIILLTIPLAAIGGLLGLYLMGIPQGFTELLGFLALFGIMLSAGILLLDFSERIIQGKLASSENRAGSGEKSCSGLKQEVFRRSLAQAGEERLMPILMTTLTTVGGLLSLMFAGGPLFEGMATVIVVGLTVGTALTLFVLPALIAIFVEDFGLKLVAVPESTDSTSEE